MPEASPELKKKVASRMVLAPAVLGLVLFLGVALPLLANAAFVLELVEADWTAVALGPSGILIWIAIVDSGLVANLPIGRNEVIDQLDVGVIVADLEDRVVSVNAAARRLAATTLNRRT